MQSCHRFDDNWSMAAELVASRIVRKPDVRSGQPIIYGTRITIWDVLGWLAAGMPEAEILSDYPELKKEDLRAVLQYAFELKDKIAQ